MWIIAVLVFGVAMFCGFLIGVAYGQEHRDE